MNGEIDRSDALAGDVPVAVRRRAAGPTTRAASEAILAVVARGRRPRRAGPQPVPRRDRRGADGHAARPARRRGRRPPRAAHPVRRRPRRDPPVRRHGRARRRRRGVRLQVGRARASAPTSCTSSTTPARMPRTRTSALRGRARRVRCRALVPRPARAPDRAAAPARRSSRSRRSTSWRAGAVTDAAARGRIPARAPYRVRFDEAGAGRARRGPRCCCATPRTSPGTTRPRGASTAPGTPSAA